MSETVNPNLIKALQAHPAVNGVDESALIAEKQRFFDEADMELLRFSFADMLGVDSDIHNPMLEEINKVIGQSRYTGLTKNVWRFIGRQKWEPDHKKYQFLMSLMGSNVRGTKHKVESGASQHIFPHEAARVIWNSPFETSNTSDFLFEAARRNNFLAELYFFVNCPDTHIPAGTSDKLEAWCQRQGIDLNTLLVDCKLPELEVRATARIDFDTIIAGKQKFFNEADGNVLSDLHMMADDFVSPTNEIQEAIGHSLHLPNGPNKAIRIIEEKAKYSAHKALVQMALSTSVARTGIVDGVEVKDFSAMHSEYRKIWRDILKGLPKYRQQMYDSVIRHDLAPEFYFMLNTPDKLTPDRAGEFFEKWCDENDINLRQLLIDYKLPEEVQTADIDTELDTLPDDDLDHGIDVVDVDGTLVGVGKASEMLAVDRASDDESPKQGRQKVPHVDWLLEAIPQHMQLEGRITLYRSRTEREKGEDKDFSHQVIEFNTIDDRKHQIATNNWYGGGTYVIKPAKDINPDDPRLVHIPDLLGSGAAWPIRCANKEQYIRSALEHCEKDLNDLDPYIPRISWANKAVQVVETCKLLLIETGQKIKTNDNAALQTGPLRGLTTSGRMASAINNGAVANLGADRIPELYDMLFEKDVDLKAHLNKPAVDATDLFNDAVDVIKTTGLVPQNGLLDGIELAGFSGEIVSRFFGLSAEGCVVGWRELIPEQRQIPANIDEFMVATGVAIDYGQGELYPNYDHPSLAGIKRQYG